MNAAQIFLILLSYLIILSYPGTRDQGPSTIGPLFGPGEPRGEERGKEEERIMQQQRKNKVQGPRDQGP